MKKADLVRSIATNTDLTQKDADNALSVMVDAISEALADGQEVSLRGLGKFTVQQRGERNARNPQTGEMVKLPASRAVRFKPSQTLKDQVN